jgi:IS5 family transposase
LVSLFDAWGVDLGRERVPDETTVCKFRHLTRRERTKNPGSDRLNQCCRRWIKGKQWYFGMKAHIGVDAQSKLIHSVAAGRDTHDRA